MPELDVIMPPAAVFAYLTAPADTTCTLADTWYPILGTFVNSPMELFELDVDKLKYTGAHTIYFEIDAHIVANGDSNGITAHFSLKKNGTANTPSTMGIFMKTAGEVFAVSGTSVIELATNDTIQMVMMSDAAGAVVTAEHLTTTIRPFKR